LFPDLAPTNREEALGALSAQLAFVLVGLVLIVIHFVRGRGRQSEAWPPRLRNVTVRCPQCAMRIDISSECLGNKIRCPGCNHPFVARAVDVDQDHEEGIQEEERPEFPGRPKLDREDFKPDLHKGQRGVPPWVWLLGGATVSLLVGG